MSVFNAQDFDSHEQVSFFHDAKTGMRAIIAVHNTNQGPALGGCRMWAYDNDDQALKDVLRLSRGMTYKAAMANVPLGGGKSVIIGDARTDKTPAVMEAMGRAVQTFNGRYIVAEDVGMGVEDMVHISKQTDHVVGLPHQGSDSAGGDPSPVTAYGVFQGLKAAARHRLGRDTIAGLKIAVQGLGNVGYHLCQHLVEEGAIITVTDVREEKIKMAVDKLGAKAVALDAIYDVDADIFAPCALGGILNDQTLPRIKAQVVAGAANNQLAEARHGDILRQRNMLYAPDYVINAGGLIAVYYEWCVRQGKKNLTREDIMQHVGKIAETLEGIFQRAEKEGVSTALAADRAAEQIFGKGKISKAA